MSAAGAAELVDPVAYVRLRSPGHTGPVRALAFGPDSERLYSAGNDKAVRVWRRPGEGESDWSPSAALRWEVGFGELGRVYALDADPATGLVAVAGRSSRGKIGDPVWFDPEQPKSFRSWRAPRDGGVLQHEQVVDSLASSPGGEWLASADLDGQVLLWRGAKHLPAGESPPPVRRVNAVDRGLWAPTGWEPRWRPIAWAGDRALLYPHLSPDGLYRQAGQVVPLWRLFRHDPATGESAEVGDGSVFYPGFLMAIAATPDGRRIAAAGVNRSYLYERDEEGAYRATPLDGALDESTRIRSLAFSPDGRVLAVGRGGARGGSAELIDVEAGAPFDRRSSWPCQAPVEACATSPDGQLAAFATGNQVRLVDLTQGPGQQPVELAGGPWVESVAFLADQQEATRLLLRSGGVTRVVDPKGESTVLTLRPDEPTPPVAPPGRGQAAGWSFDPATLTLRRAGRALRPLPLDAAMHGPVGPEAWCWINGPDGAPRGVAIGASTSGWIGVYALPADGAGAPRVARAFVGHEGGVASLAARLDGAMLASGSDDGTAALWSLDGVWDGGPTLTNHWGVRLADDPRGGCLVEGIDTQGPFFNRGVRTGDRLVRIKWRKEGRLFESTDAATIRARLAGAVPSDTPEEPFLEIEQAAEGGRRVGLNFAPIWSPLLSVYGYGQAWVAWTPSGHYEASIGGDRLIGWQFNGMPGEAPSFATAQQHHRTFRRPDLIRGLLAADNQEEAAAVEQELQAETVDNRELPTVRVTGRSVGRRGVLTVMLHVSAPEGEKIDEVALLNAEGRKADRAVGPFVGSRQVVLRFEPADGSEQEFTARVYGSSGAADADELIRYTPSPRVAEMLNRQPSAKKVLYVLSVGVSDYDESVGVGALGFPGLDARNIAAVFRDKPAHDHGETRVLTTRDETTGARLRDGLGWLRRMPDFNDTICLFFAGHSRVEGDDISLLPSDGDTQGLSSAMLVKLWFGKAAGRKVLVLDSCNSGLFKHEIKRLEDAAEEKAAQHEAIKQRAQETDDSNVGISLFASCADNELAREDTELGAGVFTGAVVRGLSGDAESKYGDVVSDLDLFLYLRLDSEATELFKANRQTPVFSIPGDLFSPERVHLNLTRHGR